MRLSSILLLASAVGVGGYLLSGTERPTTTPAKPRAIRSAALPVIAPVATAPDGEPDVDEELPDIAADTDEVADEAIRGHAPITDPAEFAMVFAVDGETYLRLSDEERATETGTPRLLEHESLHAVIAPVAARALPPAYRGWLGKRVLVEGTCEARVVGFAEVSRVFGDASDPYSYDEEGHMVSVEPWTIDGVIETGVTLAAKLDGCDGAWARAADWSPVATADATHDGALESAAREEAFATLDDELTASWKEQGGEGRWQDAATVTTTTWTHPTTNEDWAFVQAYHPGGCGEPGFARTVAYRVRENGTLGPAIFLANDDSIREVFDLDGDGQPELLVDDGDQTSLIDLAGEQHDTMSIPTRSYGCGC